MDYQFEGQFRLTEEEYCRAAHPGGLRDSITRSAICILCAIGYFYLFTDRSFTFGNVTCLLILTGIAFALPFLIKNNCRKHYRQDPANAAPRRIELSSEGIATDTTASHVQTPWHEVDRVESRDGFLFFHTRLVGCHLLPERVFGSAAAAEAGRQFIASRVAKANFGPLNVGLFDGERRDGAAESGGEFDAETSDSRKPEIPSSVHYAANLLLFTAFFTAFALVGWLTMPPPQNAPPGGTHWLLYYTMGMMGLSLVSSLPAGVMLKRRHQRGRPAAFAAFVLMLPAFPYGPVFGLIGIALLLTREARRYFAALAPAVEEVQTATMGSDDGAAVAGDTALPQTIEVRGDMNAQEVAAITSASPGGSSIVFLLTMVVGAGMAVLKLARSGTTRGEAIVSVGLLATTVFFVVVFLLLRRRAAAKDVERVAGFSYLISEDGIASPDQRMQHLNWSSLRRAATIRRTIVLFSAMGVPVVAIPTRHFRNDQEKAAALAMMRRHVADCSQL